MMWSGKSYVITTLVSCDLCCYICLLLIAKLVLFLIEKCTLYLLYLAGYLHKFKALACIVLNCFTVNESLLRSFESFNYKIGLVGIRFK